MRIKASLAIFAAIVALAGSAAEAGGPSFSCARASATDERAICHSPALRVADTRMASLFRANAVAGDRSPAEVADDETYCPTPGVSGSSG